jgi:hypothetical protein
MPNTPIPTQTQFAVENNTTGQVDYLNFQGSTLTQSKLFDYGLGAGWSVVGHLSPTELLAQNANTGLTDLLSLDQHGALVSSALGSVALPKIVGVGDFAGSKSSLFSPDQPTFVSQLGDGELDMLSFNAQTGALVQSDLVPNTAGLAPAVGVGGAYDPIDVGITAKLPALSGVGVADNVFLQLPSGQVDAIGFSGSFNDWSLQLSSSDLLPTALSNVEGINQTGFLGSPSNVDMEEFGSTSLGGPFTVKSAAVQMVTQLADGSFDLAYVNSGYDGLHLGGGTEGALYASQQLNLSMPGWHVVDAGPTAALALG